MVLSSFEELEDVFITEQTNSRSLIDKYCNISTLSARSEITLNNLVISPD